MGGHAAGEVASARVIECLEKVAPVSPIERYVDEVVNALETANRSLRKEAARRGVGTIGSTVAVLLLSERRGACVWAGDSRIYHLRRGELLRLTRDHSLVQDYVESGLLDPQEAEDSPWAHVITRAVGVDDEVNPEVHYFEIETGDRTLLCSDGLYREISDPEIAELLAPGTVREAVDALQALVLQRPARDNSTVIVVEAGSPA